MLRKVTEVFAREPKQVEVEDSWFILAFSILAYLYAHA